MRGVLITLEGIDFSGKSLQGKLLYDRLVKEWAGGRPEFVLQFREPGGTRISERVREILLDPDLAEMHPVTELLLYSAARSQLVAEKIIPALRAGRVVLCDRFHDSSTAYQGYGREISLETVENAHAIATHGIRPDLTLVFDVDPEVAEKRQIQAGRRRDRMELEARQFYRRVREGYLAIAQKEPDRVVVLPGEGDVEKIAAEVWRHVVKILPQRPPSG